MGRIDDVLRIYDDLRVLPVLFEEFEFMRTRDAYVYEHVLRTAAITASMAIDLYGKDRAPLIGYTALTHDIGMVRLPDDVLKQDIGVDRRKRRVLYGHTLVGYLLLTYYLGSAQFGNCRVALEHHERGNGVGYPRGIKLQDQITELIGTADAFDALLSVRPFRKEPFELRAALDALWYEAKLGVLSSVAVKLLIAYSRSRYEAFDAGRVIVAEETRHRWKQGPPEDEASEQGIQYVEVLRGDTGRGFDDSSMMDLVSYLGSRGVRATYDSFSIGLEPAAIKTYVLKVEAGKEEEAMKKLEEKLS